MTEQYCIHVNKDNKGNTNCKKESATVIYLEQISKSYDEEDNL